MSNEADPGAGKNGKRAWNAAQAVGIISGREKDVVYESMHNWLFGTPLDPARKQKTTTRMKARPTLLSVTLLGIGVLVGAFIDHCRLPQVSRPPPHPRLDPDRPYTLFQWSVPVVTLLSAITNADGGEVRTVRLTGLRTKAAARCTIYALVSELNCQLVSDFSNETETVLCARSQRVESRINACGEQPCTVTRLGGPTNTVRAVVDPSYADLPEFGYYVSTYGDTSTTGLLESFADEYRPLYGLLPDGTNVVQSESGFSRGTNGSPERYLFYGCLENGQRVGTWYEERPGGNKSRVVYYKEKVSAYAAADGCRERPGVSYMRFLRHDEYSKSLMECVNVKWENDALRMIHMGSLSFPRHRITLNWNEAGKLDSIEAFVFDKPICLASNITADVWMPATLQDVLPALPGETGNDVY